MTASGSMLPFILLAVLALASGWASRRSKELIWMVFCRAGGEARAISPFGRPLLRGAVRDARELPPFLRYWLRPASNSQLPNSLAFSGKCDLLWHVPTRVRRSGN